MKAVRSHLVAGLAAATLLATAGTAAAGTAAGSAADAAAASPAKVIVDTSRPGTALAADFVGLSYEMRELSMGSFDPTTGNLVQLFKTLGRSNIRIGGNTLD